MPESVVDVLIIGAGPTGLTAAAEAARLGLSVRIVERKPRRSTYSKALVNHARTLEVFETMGVAAQILDVGVRFAGLNTYVGGARHHYRIDLLNQPWGDTAYPFWLSVPQYDTERVLEQHLQNLGVEVEWNAKLIGVEQMADQVSSRVVSDQGTEMIVSRWVVGCDGGRSTTREAVGLVLDRSSAGATFVLADILTTTDLIQDEGHTFLHPEGVLLIVPMPEDKRFRIIAHVPNADPDQELNAEFFDSLILRRAGINFGSHDLDWTSQFDLSHGLVDHYRRGRVFLAGDAAHIHSPVGGQGLNTGAQDAHNLLWKLRLAGQIDDSDAQEALLDSYQIERQPVARGMVDATAKATRVLTLQNPFLQIFRTPAVRFAVRQSWMQARLSRGVGMLDLRYADSPILGQTPAAGSRLPDLVFDDGRRLHTELDPIRHTWVAIGDVDLPEQLPNDLPVVRVMPDELRPGQSLPAAAVFLVRPDRVVAADGGSVDAVWGALPHAVAL